MTLKIMMMIKKSNIIIITIIMKKTIMIMIIPITIIFSTSAQVFPREASDIHNSAISKYFLYSFEA